MTDITRAVASRQTVNPRTVLAFYGTVLGLTFGAILGAVAILASTDTATYLIPWLLGFGGIILVLLLVAVFVVTLKDPSKLMLGQITGTEYAAIHRAILGSSSTGEHLALIEDERLLVPATGTPLPTETSDPIDDESAFLAEDEEGGVVR